MRENYYYLVAGLPEIFFDRPEEAPQFSEFVNQITEHLGPQDLKLLFYLRLPIDNMNLAILLDGVKLPFLKGGNFTEEELKGGVKDPQIFPDYVQKVIEAWQRDTPLFNNITWEDQLNWLFYEDMEGISNPFLRDWFVFDVNLKNMLAVMSCSAYNIPVERRVADRIDCTCAQAVITRNEVAEMIVGSSSTFSATRPVFETAAQILSLDKKDIESFERIVDTIKWAWLDNATELDYFNMEFLLSYGLKLQITDRWKTLSEETGKEAFHQFLSSFDTSCEALLSRELIQ